MKSVKKHSAARIAEQLRVLEFPVHKLRARRPQELVIYDLEGSFLKEPMAPQTLRGAWGVPLVSLVCVFLYKAARPLSLVV